MYKKSHSLHPSTLFDPGSKLKLSGFETQNQGAQIKIIVEKAKLFRIEVWLSKNVVKSPRSSHQNTIFDWCSKLTPYFFMVEFFVPRTEIRVLFQPSS